MKKLILLSLIVLYTVSSINAIGFEEFSPGEIVDDSVLVYYPFSVDLNYTTFSLSISEGTMDFYNITKQYIGSNGFGNVLETYPAPGATSYETADLNNSYFTLTINAVDIVDIDSLIFSVGKGGMADPRGYFIRSSIDNFATDLISETLPAGGQTAPARKVIALGSEFDNISTVTFRFYIFTPDPVSNSVDWRDLSLVYDDNKTIICYEGDPAEIVSVTDASGGDHNISYAWYSSINDFTDSTLILGATSASYDPPSGLTVNTSYRRYAKDDTYSTTLTAAPGTWEVIVYEEFSAGAIATSGETICYFGDPAEIVSVTDASGGDEIIYYAWYSSINDFADSTVIAGATSASYNPPAGLTETTSYRRYAKDGSCNTELAAASGTYTITVDIPNSIDLTGYSELGVNLYPNPSNGLVFVRIELPVTNDIGIAVYDINGKIILSKHDPGTQDVTINLTGEKPGIYFVKINIGDRNIFKKLILK